MFTADAINGFEVAVCFSCTTCHNSNTMHIESEKITLTRPFCNGHALGDFYITVEDSSLVSLFEDIESCHMFIHAWETITHLKLLRQQCIIVDGVPLVFQAHGSHFSL